MIEENFEIHVWNLPKDKVYIKLKDEFRKDLFNNIILKVGGYTKLRKFLNRDIRKFISGERRTSLKVINKIITKLSAKNETFLWKQIENNIEEIVYGGKFGPGRGIPILSPKFPIKLNPELANLLGHIVGDGTINLKGSTYGIIEYFNSNKVLIENFIKNIQIAFGNTRCEFAKGKKYAIRAPKSVGMILKVILGELENFRKRISSLMLQINNPNVVAAYIKAIYDDESNVSYKKNTYTREIVLGMRNKQVIENVHHLLKKIGIQPNPIRLCYYIRIEPGIRKRFFTKAWEKGTFQKLGINEKRYKEYLRAKKGRFRILPTLSLVKKICKLSNFNLTNVLENSELIPHYVFGISCRKNLEDFASKIGLDHSEKAEKLRELLTEYKYNGVRYDEKILKCLNKQPMTTTDLAQIIHKPRHYILYRLKLLEKLGKVSRVKTNGHDKLGRFTPSLWKVL